MRRRIALAVIALHCLLLWLLAVGFRHSDDRPMQPQRQFVSLWITEPAPVMPAESPQPERASERASSTRPSVAPRPLPMPVTPPLEPRPDLSPPAATAMQPSVADAPTVDWANEGRIAARRAGQAIGGPPPRTTFSEPPKTLPKPCVPKERSLKWKGEEKTKGGSCGLTLGYSCRDRENWHLFDDMKDPDQSPSSVPDPNICD